MWGLQAEHSQAFGRHEAASTEDTVAPEPEKKPVPKAKPAAKPAQQTKTASASLEELMKLMEQEQEKLKKQLDKK